MTAPNKTHRVVLTGHLLPGFDPTLVKSALARLMKKRPEDVAPILNRRAPTPFKNPLTREAAHQLAVKLEEIGLEARIELLASSAAADSGGRAAGVARTLCPACGHLLERFLHACPACGALLTTLTVQAKEDPPARDTARVVAEDTPSRSQRIRDFIGPNASYYLEKFQAFGPQETGRFALTWHWPALFFGFLWAAYRKLWLWSAFLLIGGTFTAYLAPAGAVILWLTWAASANYIYYRHVTHQLAPARRLLGRRRTTATDLLRPGGTSRLAVAAGLVVLVLFPAVFETLIVKEVSRLAGHDVRVQMGTASDRNSLNLRAMTDVDVARAAVRINLVMQEVLAWQAANPGKALPASLSVIARQRGLAGEALTDPWNNTFRLVTTGGLAELVSAGRDGRMDTPDDLRLPMP